MIDVENNRPAVVILPRFAQMRLTPHLFCARVCGKDSFHFSIVCLFVFT